MRTRSLSFVAALASVCCAQPSIAADLPRRYEQPVSLVQPNWMGFYFGGQTGAILNGRGDRLVVSEDGGPLVLPPLGGRGGRTGVAARSKARPSFKACMPVITGASTGRPS